MSVTKLKLFYTPMCPKCPTIKGYLEDKEIEKEFVDAASPEGLKQAKEYGVSRVPTVLFFDEKGDLINEAYSLDEVKRVLENQTLS